MKFSSSGVNLEQFEFSRTPAVRSLKGDKSWAKKIASSKFIFLAGIARKGRAEYLVAARNIAKDYPLAELALRSRVRRKK